MSVVNDRFDAKHVADRESGCWVWTASVRKDGYGQFKVGGKMVRAHRFAYERAKEAIPHGMFICHKCDNPRCVNPDHLFIGTPMDNVSDKVAKGRQARGEKNSNVKLTHREVNQIRAAIGKTHQELANIYGVCRSNIGFIRRNTAWVYHPSDRREAVTASPRA